MLSLRLARVRLLEMTVHALDRAARLEWSPQQEAELAAYFYLRKIGCTVIARNWKSGRSAGDIDLIAWEGQTLCFVDVGTRTRPPASAHVPAGSGSRPDRLLRSLAGDYLSKASLAGTPTRFDLILVDLEDQQQLKSHRRPESRQRKPEIEFLRGAF